MIHSRPDNPNLEVGRRQLAEYLRMYLVDVEAVVGMCSWKDPRKQTRSRTRYLKQVERSQAFTLTRP